MKRVCALLVSLLLLFAGCTTLAAQTATTAPPVSETPSPTPEPTPTEEPTPSPEPTPEPVDLSQLPIEFRGVQLRETEDGDLEMTADIENVGELAVTRIRIITRAHEGPQATGEEEMLGIQSAERFAPGDVFPVDYYWTLGSRADFAYIDYALYSVKTEDGEEIVIPEYQYEWRTISVEEALAEDVPETEAPEEEED